MDKIKLYLAELRAPFFTATIVPIILGAAMAWHSGVGFNWWLFLLTLIAGVFLHAGANVANDYYDHKSGNDEVNTEFIRPFTGGSRMIQKRLLTPREVITEALICYAVGSLIGLWLAYQRGLPILWIGIIGVLTSFFYSAPPIKFVHRGVGEVFIGLNFGILMTLGSYYVQVQRLDWAPVIAAIPIALLIMAVLYINGFQDYNADKSVGKRNWVVRLGRERAAMGYVVFIGAIYLSIALGILTKALPAWALASFVTMLVAVKAIRIVRANYNNVQDLAPANAATIQLHLFIGLILAASCLIP